MFIFIFIFDIHQVLKYLATPPRFRCRTTERRMSPHHERAATLTETQPEDQLRHKPKRPTDKRDPKQAKPKKAATRTETQPEDQLRNKPKRPTDKRDPKQAEPEKKREEEGGANSCIPRSCKAVVEKQGSGHP